MPSSLDRTRLWLSFALRRRLRGLQNAMHRGQFATEISEPLPLLLKEHRLPLHRRLAGVAPELFVNKRRNLELAIAPLDGLLLRPGKLFSLWRLVGPPTAARGYLDGLVLERGRPARGVGGGLCQLANALFWLALHSELEIVERHHHSLDLFPDDQRQVPFGTGATIVYNFKDLRFRNPGPRTYQFRLALTREELVASLWSDHSPGRRYAIREIGHAYEEKPEGLYRKNTIQREILDENTGDLQTEVLFHNHSRCQYSRGALP